ncbi:VOC family protein [Paractinoplanes rhizophilus]|jgi:catechol 2,3-dioxygenase-like lactoylglutathione lyase family enzyme|uniref:VOC family protein n=1 Tax=Paractinoplanes rhizophilus TaxID=1416877 RepID=A0ABW2HSW3_9ACTN|nr:VOC family protein [Actinoplanes sp.]
MTFESVAPIVPVRDLDAAIDRYRRLGFAVRAYAGPQRYGFADRDGVSIHLSEHHHDQHDHEHPHTSVYLYVSDADAVRREWDGVEGQLSEVMDTPWGMREFAYADPDGTVFRVGHHLPR